MIVIKELVNAKLSRKTPIVYRQLNSARENAGLDASLLTHTSLLPETIVQGS